MTRSRRPDAAALALQQLAALRRERDETALVAGLAAILRVAPGQIVASAADLAAERELPALRPALLAALHRLYDGDTDPTCAGKAGCTGALDRLDHSDRSGYVRGATFEQLQPGWPKPEDVAPPLRAASVHALAGFGGVDALMVLARAAHDPHPVVRSAAARALVRTGEPAAAALALSAILLDDDAVVVADALGSLIALRTADGLVEAHALYARADRALTPLVDLTLGQSRLDAVLPLLRCRLAEPGTAADRRGTLLAVGMLRTEGSRRLLLEIVESGPISDAVVAISALATQSMLPARRREVEEAARGRGLDAAIGEAFGPVGDRRPER